MAKVFLDTNIIINFLGEEEGRITSDIFKDDEVYISPLSIHIIMYVLKRKVPSPDIEASIRPFLMVHFDENISFLALSGPTNDFEDNVQLHSAAEAECDIFLTEDKRLLGMRFFGKTRITQSLPLV